MRGTTLPRSLLPAIRLAAFLALLPFRVEAQVAVSDVSLVSDATWIGRADVGLLAATDGLDVGARDVAEPVGLKRTSTRQALLIGGLAASVAAYGYFVLQFNNDRGAAGKAEQAYQEDVRQNAQSYLDQGTPLDRTPTFLAWQDAFDNAKSSREWAARAGFLAVVIGFFAILDAATSYDGPTPRTSGMAIRPTVGLTPLHNDLLVGARLKF